MAQALFVIFISSLLGGTAVSLAGVGSTLVILPALIFTLPLILHKAVAIKVAIATTLAAATVAAGSSTVLHIKQATICKQAVLLILPVYVLFGVLGPLIAHHMPGQFYHGLIGGLLIIASLKLIFTTKNKHIDDSNQGDLNIFGLLIMSILSSLVASISGVATGLLMIPYLSDFLPYRTAIGTSVTCAVVGCGSATLTYIYIGMHYHHAILPAYSLGYVYLPAFFILSLGIILATWISFKLAHNIQVNWLRWTLAFFIFISALSVIL